MKRNDSCDRSPKKVKRNRVRIMVFIGLGGIVLSGMIGANLFWVENRSEGRSTVNESVSGTVNDRGTIIIKNEVAGQTTIITLIPKAPR